MNYETVNISKITIVRTNWQSEKYEATSRKMIDRVPTIIKSQATKPVIIIADFRSIIAKDDKIQH